MHSRSPILGNRLSSAALRYRQAWRSTEEPSGGRLRLRAVPQGATEVSALDDPTLQAELEAVLFLAREPLFSRRLAQLARLEDGTQARTLARRISKRLDATGRAFRVEAVAGGMQMLTRPQFAPWLRRMLGAPAELRFSGPSMETLAVVAYRQPVLRAEIEAVRGVQCGEILRQLMERQLVRIAGRSDELGRPFLYGTTRKFMQVFGLRHLEDLPRAEQLLKSLVEEETGELDETVGETDGHEENETMTTTMAAVDSEERIEATEMAIGAETEVLSPNKARADLDEDLDKDDDGDEDDDDGFEKDDWKEVDDDDSDDDDSDDDDSDEDDDWDDEDDDDENWDDKDDKGDKSDKSDKSDA